MGALLCGRYRLLRLLAVGGMAAVYEARHRNGHPVAVKVLHARFTKDPEVAGLFAREAEAANSIESPLVVPVLDDDVDEEAGPFLVMPLLEGETVRARAERREGGLGVAEVVGLALEVLAALREVHAAGWVHGDVKPENVFVTSRGEVRLLDFGVALASAEAREPRAGGTGRALGTPGFMPPEQVLGRRHEIDARSDVWAVGALIFTLLTGRTVHAAKSTSATLARTAARAAPSLSTILPHAPRGLAAVVDRALAQDRHARWSDAAAMADALRRVAPPGSMSVSREALSTMPTPGGSDSSHHGIEEWALPTMHLDAPPSRLRRCMVHLAGLAVASFLAVAAAHGAWKSVGVRSRESPARRAEPAAELVDVAPLRPTRGLGAVSLESPSWYAIPVGRP